MVAVPPGVSPAASAREILVVGARGALGVVPAPVRQARVQLLVALPSGEGQLADALVVVDLVDASAAILARVDGAVVDVRLAVDAGVARQAFARVGG